MPVHILEDTSHSDSEDVSSTLRPEVLTAERHGGVGEQQQARLLALPAENTERMRVQ